MNYLSALKRQTGLSRSVETGGVDTMNVPRSKTVAPIDRSVEVTAPQSLSAPSHEQTNSINPIAQERSTTQTKANDHELNSDALKDKLAPSTIIMSDSSDVGLPPQSRTNVVKPIDMSYETETQPVESVGTQNDLSQSSQKHSLAEKKNSSKTAIHAVREIHVHQEIKSDTNDLSEHKSREQTKQPKTTMSISPTIAELSSEKNARVMNVFDEVKQWVSEAPTKAEHIETQNIEEHDWIAPLASVGLRQQDASKSVNQSHKNSARPTTSDPMVQDFNLSIGNINIEIEAPATSVETRQPTREKATTPETSFLNWQRHYMDFY